MGNTLFYSIKDSLVSVVSEDEAQKLFKAGIFSTRGKDVSVFISDDGKEVSEIIETVIFDFDKNTIIPYVKFLDTPPTGSSTSPLLIYAIVGVVGLFFAYFVFFGKESDSLPELTGTSATLINFPRSVPVEPVKPVESVNTGSLVSVEPVEPVEPLTNKQKNIYEAQIHSLKLEISSLNSANEIYLSRYSEAEKLQNEAKEYAREQLNESLTLREELKTCQSTQLTKEETKILEAGKKVLELCTTKSSPECLDLFFKQ